MDDSQVSEAKKNVRYSKGEVELKCSEHEDELVVRGCFLRDAKKIFWCTECILDDPEFVGKYKKFMKPVHEYLSQVADKAESAGELREKNMDNMPKYVNKYIEK